MSDHVNGARPTSATEEALDWFVRRDAGVPPSAEQKAFEAWLSADPANRAAYAEIERIWSDLDRISADRPARIACVNRTGAEAQAVFPERGAARHRRRGWAAGLAVAAGICFIAATGLDLPLRLQADALSETGETRTVALPDGSTVVLNTASAIAIDYTAKERRIELLRGEAAFTVAGDGHRPFRVEVAGGVSTALGTVFLVRRRDDGATVTVVESRVAVAYGKGGGPAQEAVLSASERVSYAAGGGLGPIETVNLQSATAWRRGKLIFIDRTLGEVIDELNRYHFGQIAVVGDELRAMPVNGVFETRDPLAVVDALEESLGLASTRVSGFLILLHR